MPATIGFIISMIGIALIIGAVIYGQVRGSLDIKSKPVGDGQYGNQRWASAKEQNEAFQLIPFEPEKWRKGKHLPARMEGCTVLGYIYQNMQINAMIDTSDSHTILVSPPGAGKTTCCAYPNMEAACACGFSFLYTDTKGTAFRDYAGIAQRYYGYAPYVIDLRNPTRSHGFNLLHLVNKYMDLYKGSGKIEYKARAERYAKITAKTIVRTKGFDGGGQNAFFYDAAEGLIASTILLVSEFCGDGERHIVSVFKIIQELLQVKTPAPTKEERENKIKPKNEFQKLIELLPSEHKARWLAGAALYTADASMHSVISTAMSRLLSFIDSEMEQIICFDSEIDTEAFCSEKVAVFIVFPEEDNTKAFLVSMFVSQLYNECLTIANQSDRDKLARRVMFYLDEFGTMPPFDNASQMFSASRSRNIILFPMLQSLAQLDQNYTPAGAEIILDSCQNAMFGGQAPLSKRADELSKALGTQTVQSGSVSHSGNGISPANTTQSLLMIQKSLMTSDDLKSMPKNQWILTKTHMHPMKTVMKRYNEWGIKLDCPYEIPENAAREVRYASEAELFRKVLEEYHSDGISPRQTAGRETVSSNHTRRQISDDLLK